MSTDPAVVVCVGAPAADQTTPVKVAVPAPVVAAWCKIRVNDCDTPETTAGMVTVAAVDAVNVAVITVPPDSAGNVVDVVRVPSA